MTLGVRVLFASAFSGYDSVQVRMDVAAEFKNGCLLKGVERALILLYFFSTLEQYAHRGEQRKGVVSQVSLRLPVWWRSPRVVQQQLHPPISSSCTASTKSSFINRAHVWPLSARPGRGGHKMGLAET